MAWVEQHSGGYRGRYLDAKGVKRTAGSSQSKRKARQMAETEEARIREGRWQDPTAGRVLFADYCTKAWLPNRVMEINTRSTYESHFNACLREQFGAMQGRRITTPVVQAWVAGMVEGGVKPGTVVARYKALQTILAARRGASAMRDGLIATNPCHGIDLPTAPPREVTIYTPDEVDAIIEALPAWWRLLPLLDSELGVRWGELMGLVVSDFTTTFRGVRVHQTIVESSKARSGTGTPFTWKAYPKGKRARDIGISREAAEAVRAHVERLGLGPGDRLFSMEDPKAEGKPRRTLEWPEGLPPSRSYFRSVWRRAIAEAGVPVRRFHDLRASNISWLLAGGLDVPATMERAGHTQLSTTRRYTKSMDEDHERALDALASVRKRYRA